MSAGLLARIERASALGREVVFLDGDTPERAPWAELHDEALRMAALLQQRGLAPGDRVALVGSSSRLMYNALQACWLAGAAVVIPPLRSRLETDDEFRGRTVERLRLGEVSFILCDADHAEVASSVPGLPGPTALEQLGADSTGLGPDSCQPPPEDPDRTLILQFTSGSTADPKGVVIPERCLLDNLDAILTRAPLDIDNDVIVSWLPLYHDMGLVYNAALALMTGAQFVLAPPARFMTSPASWMQWMDAFGGTWTIGPNSSVAISARLLATGPRLDLSRCTRLGSGAEPIDPDVMAAFARTGAGHGFDPGALFVGYGMAETTVCVSFTPPGSGFSADAIDAEALEHDGVAVPRAPDAPGVRLLARCGPPLRGMEVRFCDPDTGQQVSDRTAGELEVRGPSVVPGYFRRPDATAAAFRPDGWLRTGDLGYMSEGELVVCGRLKDLIIVGGRNLFPEDLERAAQTVPGVRAGNVIAFGVNGGRKGDAVVVVAEVKEGDPEQIRDGIARAVGRVSGVRPDDIVLLPPGALPKTSSGKLRRSACQAGYRAGELERL